MYTILCSVLILAAFIMSDQKTPHLNGAFYGPSIPPQPRTYHRHGYARRATCCCGCCLLKILLQILLTALFIVAIAAFVFWLIFRPNRVNFHANQASLTQFNFTGNGTLHYNLALNITVRNPNKRIGVYYDRIEARASYHDARFDAVTLTPFYQGHKNTSYLRPAFDGQNLVLLGSKGKTEYNKERDSGVYNIDVDLYLRVRFKLGWFKTSRFKPEVKCGLKVPISSSGAGTMETTKCDIDYF